MKERLRRNLFLILSLPKTIYFNLRAFNFKIAIRLPIVVSYKTKIREIHKNKIILKNWNESHYHILFGFGGSKHIIANGSPCIIIGKDANITFNGKSKFADGASLRCDKGKLIIGKNFSINKNCCISCNYDMSFGNDILVGWNVNIRDTDGHKVFQAGERKESKKSVEIGDHVWICSFSDILKGSKICNNSIVAWRSCVLKSFEQENVLIGGYPAKILQENIEWEA